MFEVGYRDADGRQRWRGPFETITAARAARDDARVKARGGERESANPRLKFGEAADRWLAEQVAELRPATRASYRSYVENHLRPRWGNRRMDAIDVTDAARLVRELRAAGLAEWTISGILQRGESGVQVRAAALLVARGQPVRGAGDERAAEAEHDAGAADLHRRRAGAGARRVDGAVADAVPARERRRRAARASCSGCGGRTSSSATSTAATIRFAHPGRSRRQARGAEDRGEQGDAASARARRR